MRSHGIGIYLYCRQCNGASPIASVTVVIATLLIELYIVYYMDTVEYQCYHCKHKNLKKPHYCNGCNNSFHMCCLKKKHKIVSEKNEIIVCPAKLTEMGGHLQEMEAADAGNRKRRCLEEGTEYESGDVTARLDGIMNKISDLTISQDNLLFDINEMIFNELKELKTNIEYMIVNTVRKEIQNLKNEIMNTNTIHNKQTNGRETVEKKKKEDLYAIKAQKSRLDTIIIEPKASQDNMKTMSQVKKSIDVVKFGVEIDRISNAQRGKVILGCKNKDDTSKIAHELKTKIGQSYNIRVPEKKLPKLKVIDVEEDVLVMKEDEIVELMTRQNEIVINRDNKIEIKKIARGKNLTSILIVETDPKLHKTMLEKRRIKLGWSNCRVFDCISVVRCFKCWGYHHFAKDCKKEMVICRKCAGNHAEKECQSDMHKCINCTKMVEEFKIKGIDVRHTATDEACSYYLRVKNKQQKNTKYYSE